MQLFLSITTPQQLEHWHTEEQVTPKQLQATSGKWLWIDALLKAVGHPEEYPQQRTSLNSAGTWANNKIRNTAEER
jgi:hypothetical protein